MLTGHPRRAAAALALLAATALAATGLAACGGAGGTRTSEASCAAGSPPAYLAKAQIAFIGVMLPGPAVHTGQGDWLTSPARVRVERYLKGTGPRVVTVVTGVTQNAGGVAVAEDGIEATAGQRWTIYTSSTKMPYDTSICGGSAPVSAGT